MRITLAFVAAALASLATAQSAGPNPFNIPTPGYLLQAGEPTEFTWEPTTDGTVTLQLRTGPNGDLNPGTIIVANIPNDGRYTYTPPSDTVEDNSYTIEIIDDSDPTQTNFTPQFIILSPVKAIPSIASESASASASASASVLASATAPITSSASASIETTMSMMTTSGVSSSPATSAESGSSDTATATETSSSEESTSSPSETTTGSASAQSLSIPTGNAAAAIKVQGGLLAVAMGVYIVL
ncbi:hypothetical protein MMC24_002270 [Lignoscripta atroalba]|nr:hypothetical protein [Lignoscripta atroalba]